MKVILVTFICLIFTLFYAGTLSAEYYRWVDKNGETQYGDQVPAEEVERGRERVSQDGKVIEKVEPAKSPEEKILELFNTLIPSLNESI